MFAPVGLNRFDDSVGWSHAPGGDCAGWAETKRTRRPPLGGRRTAEALKRGCPCIDGRPRDSEHHPEGRPTADRLLSAESVAALGVNAMPRKADVSAPGRCPQY